MLHGSLTSRVAGLATCLTDGTSKSLDFRLAFDCSAGDRLSEVADGDDLRAATLIGGVDGVDGVEDVRGVEEVEGVGGV